MLASREKRVVVFCLLLVAATLAFYNPIVRNQFVDFDDMAYILKNSHVQGGLTWDTVKWSFTTFYYGNWHPLTWLSHALDYQVFRLNPIGHHYTSLLLHTANAVFCSCCCGGRLDSPGPVWWWLLCLLCTRSTLSG